MKESRRQCKVPLISSGVLEKYIGIDVMIFVIICENRIKRCYSFFFKPEKRSPVQLISFVAEVARIKKAVSLHV